AAVRLEPRPPREPPRGGARRTARCVPLQPAATGPPGRARDSGPGKPRPGRERDPQDERPARPLARLTRSGRYLCDPAMYVRDVSGLRYRWVVLAAGTLAQASFSASSVGLPALGPALKSHYGLTLGETGVVRGAIGSGT